MNTKNNKRRRESIAKMEKAFVELLQEKELKEISVSEICKLTGLNRSTFYANFLDIYDLADHIRDKLEEEFSELFPQQHDNEQGGAVKMFTHIKENQLFYQTYFKLGYDEKHQALVYDSKRAEEESFDSEHIQYHIEFFRNGINAMIKLWLRGGCKESPEEMVTILQKEYKGRF